MVYSRIILFICLYHFFQIANADGQCQRFVWRWDYSNTFYNCYDASSCGSKGAAYISRDGNVTYKAENCYLNSYQSFVCTFKKVSGDPYAPQSPEHTVGRFTEPDPNCKCLPKGAIRSGIGLRKKGEFFNPPPTVCVDKCLYDFTEATVAQEVREDGLITTLFYGDGKLLGQACPKDDEDDDLPPPNPCKKKNEKGEFVDKDYCDSPPDKCPDGYISGTFNGKKICVKQEKNDKDKCKPTVSDPYKCLPNQPKPEKPDNDGNCKPPKVKSMMGTTAYCTDPEVPPNPDGSCPKGYVKQTYDGTSICVPDNQSPDDEGGCPLNTVKITLSNGSKVCRGLGDTDNGGSASDPAGDGGTGDGDGDGDGDCNPKKDFLCKDADLPDLDNSKLNVNELELPALDENKISWSQSCPAPETVTLANKTYNFEYTKLCMFLSDYINPFMIAFGYFSGAMIIIGAVRK